MVATIAPNIHNPIQRSLSDNLENMLIWLKKYFLVTLNLINLVF